MRWRKEIAFVLLDVRVPLLKKDAFALSISLSSAVMRRAPSCRSYCKSHAYAHKRRNQGDALALDSMQD